MSGSESIKTISRRVGIVDDHTMMREGLKLFVDSLEGFSTAWTTPSSREAITLIETDPPEVMMVDLSLPDRDGLELVKDIIAISPLMVILVVSMHQEKLYALRVLKAGAKGYVMKSAPHHELEAALRKVAAGGIAISPAISEMLLGAYATGTTPGPDEALPSLSDRELSVFRLIGEGCSASQISDRLKISPKTVDVHRMNIRNKLGLEDGAALTRWAIRWTETRRLEAD
jgi:DNA-binding NarL/FixJ family response regulator